ncbi:MAG: hypothetical protein K2X87_09315 [Gemmataceae bacterium]|nr:hypothetical protein [Gemmataceae bacterium]
MAPSSVYIHLLGIEEVRALLQEAVRSAWDAAREGDPIDLGSGEIGIKYRYPAFTDWPFCRIVEDFAKARKPAQGLPELLESALPGLSDAHFADVLELVETHRIRRLSMKIAVPWSYKTGDVDPPADAKPEPEPVVVNIDATDCLPEVEGQIEQALRAIEDAAKEKQ